jgi:putative transposase
MLVTWTWLLRPNKAQRRLLEAALESQRLLYNAALQERTSAWRLQRKSITKLDQQKSLTVIRRDDPPGYGTQPVTMGRWTLTRLDEAMSGFFRRVKKGQTPGFPRYKSAYRWHTFGFDEFKGLSIRNGRLRIKGFHRGIRINRDRRLPTNAVPKSATVTRKGDRWFINIAIETSAIMRQHDGGKPIGIDAGIETLATVSDNTNDVFIENARAGSRRAAELQRAQRALARCRKGSKRRRKVKAQLLVVHQRIANARNDHLHRNTAAIARAYPLIFVEKLLIRNMTRSAAGTADKPGINVRAKAGLNRSMLDAGIGRFLTLLTYKAERAGGSVVRVDAKGTSQDCSACGARVEKDLAVRIHKCLHCGLRIHRDVNAARNILARGLAAHAASGGGPAPGEPNVGGCAMRAPGTLLAA